MRIVKIQTQRSLISCQVLWVVIGDPDLGVQQVHDGRVTAKNFDVSRRYHGEMGRDTMYTVCSNKAEINKILDCIIHITKKIGMRGGRNMLLEIDKG